MKEKTMVVSISETHSGVSQSLASLLSLDDKLRNNMQRIKFSDKEFSPKFKDEKGNDITLDDKNLIIAYYASPFNIPADLSYRSLQVIGTASEYNINEMMLVIPQLPYARSDRKIDMQGNQSKLYAELLASAGKGKLSKVITVDVHNPEISNFYEEQGIEFVNIQTQDLFADYFLNHSSLIDKLGDLAVVSPDQGAIERAKEFSSALGINLPLMTLKKWREKANSSAHTKVGDPEMINGDDIEGRHVIICDDMIDTGGTIQKTVDYLMNNNTYGKPKDISFAFTHPVLGGDSYEMIQTKLIDIPHIRELVTTNTRPYITEKMIPSFSEKTSVLLIDQTIASVVGKSYGKLVEKGYKVHRYDNHFKNQ